MHRVIFVKIELGGQKIVKKRGPFFFFSPKPNKILQLQSKITVDLFFSFFSPNSKKWSQGVKKL